MTWLDYVREALLSRGGIADIKEIYSEVARLMGRKLDREDRASVRKTLYYNSSDSRAWRGRSDAFFSVRGVRGKIKGNAGGVWGLRELGPETPKANDLDLGKQPKGRANPQRIRAEVYRVVRDTAVSKALKRLHQNRCQRCNGTITLIDRQTYSEAHHLRPLGRPHNGPDTPENVVVVCPNCHAMFDYFALPIRIADLRTHKNHAIAAKHVAYHNKEHRIRSGLKRTK